MEIRYRKCTAGKAMRNQVGYREKHYIPMVMFGRFGMPLNRQFDTCTRANEWAERFAGKWNRAEDRRLAEDLRLSKEMQREPEEGGEGGGEGNGVPDQEAGSASEPVGHPQAG